ncbi:hypothetical protein AB0M86_48930 [Streptomyces sp. NPDC051639]|uniref:hypothetical protein n=1 Tax=Streptomyces sp. NPDC051639 TaxID=3155671 RepID=UPI00343B13EE
MVAEVDSLLTRQVHLFDTDRLDSLSVVVLPVRIEDIHGVSISEFVLFDSRFTCIDAIVEVISHHAGTAEGKIRRRTPFVTCVSATAFRPILDEGEAHVLQGCMPSTREHSAPRHGTHFVSNTHVRSGPPRR